MGKVGGLEVLRGFVILYTVWALSCGLLGAIEGFGARKTMIGFTF